MKKERNHLCLHCTIMFAIEAFYEHRGDLDDATGQRVINLPEAITKTAEALAELVHTAPMSRPERRQFQKYARECLEAGFRYQATGKAQAVAVGKAEVEH